MKNRQSKIFGALYFACIISCVLLSALLVSDVWGRYFSGASGGDGARVARFDVSVTPDEENPEALNFGITQTTGEWSFTVTNNSEVAVEYDIIITTKEALPQGVALKIGGQSPSVSGINYTFENAGRLSVGGVAEHTLEITVSDFSYRIEQNGITVKIVARQVD